MQTVWVEVTTRTQRQLVRLLDDDTTFIQTEGGAVVLDLRPIVIELGDQVAVIGKAAESPGVLGKDRDHRREPARDRADDHEDSPSGRQLDVARCARRRSTRDLAGTRPPEDRDPSVALGLVVVGLLLLVVRRFAGDYLVDQLAKDDGVKPAAHAAWSILTQILADRAWVWIILGLVTLLGVWFVGDTRLAAQARRASAPVLQSRVTTYAIAAAALLVIALLAPSVATSWLMALLLIALIVAGIELVRRIVGREVVQST